MVTIKRIGRSISSHVGYYAMLILAAVLCVAVGVFFSSAAMAGGGEAGVTTMAVKNAANTDGAKVFVALKCIKCHSVKALNIKPIKPKKTIVDLSNVGADHNPDWFAKWLKKEVKKESRRKKGKQIKHKIKFKGDAQQLSNLVAWLSGLKKK